MSSTSSFSVDYSNAGISSSSSFSVDYSKAGISSSSSFSADREALRESIERNEYQSIVTEEYIKSIQTKEKSGSGFFGIVYRGYDSVLHKTVAIKILDIQLMAGDIKPEIIEEKKKSFHKEQAVRYSKICRVNDL